MVEQTKVVASWEDEEEEEEEVAAPVAAEASAPKGPLKPKQVLPISRFQALLHYPFTKS